MGRGRRRRLCCTWGILTLVRRTCRGHAPGRGYEREEARRRRQDNRSADKRRGLHRAERRQGPSIIWISSVYLLHSLLSVTPWSARRQNSPSTATIMSSAEPSNIASRDAIRTVFEAFRVELDDHNDRRERLIKVRAELRIRALAHVGIVAKPRHHQPLEKGHLSPPPRSHRRSLRQRDRRKRRQA